MSSHHFVRENQEPALLVIQPISNLAHLYQLLEWNPTIIASEESIGWLLEYNIKVDVVICINASLRGLKEILAFQQPVRFLTFNPLSEGILEKGISYIQDIPIQAVHILGAIKSADFHLFSQNNIDITYSDGEWVWIYCNKDQFKKWFRKDQKLFLMDINVVISGVFSIKENCKYIILTTAEGIMFFKSKMPFWLGEYIG